MKNLWTKQEIEYLIAHYPTTPSGELAKHLGRTTNAVNVKASMLKIKRPIEFIKAQLSGGARYRFKKGNLPHNKDKKWSDYMSENSKDKLLQTCFKKGNLPHNTKHDGVISIRKDKSGKEYQFIRISKANWIALHVHLWKQHHGEIPKGLLVVFKDHNPMNCRIENLELISRIENMNRNTFHRYPTELKKTIKLLKNVKSKLEPSK